MRLCVRRLQTLVKQGYLSIYPAASEYRIDMFFQPQVLNICGLSWILVHRVFVCINSWIHIEKYICVHTQIESNRGRMLKTMDR